MMRYLWLVVLCALALGLAFTNTAEAKPRYNRWDAAPLNADILLRYCLLVQVPSNGRHDDVAIGGVLCDFSRARKGYRR